MELDLNFQGEEHYLKKYLFNVKTQRSDGLLLQVHHSFTDFGGENKSFRFIHAAFNDLGTHISVCDHKGNVFVIDMEMEKYWQLPNVGIPTVISYSVLHKQELLLGLNTASILFIHTETGAVTSVLNGHSFPPIDASYSNDGYYCLTSCTEEAIVWDLSSQAQVHKLSLKSEVSLKKVIFMPVTNYILACFQDDTMHVWKFGSFECIKQIVPETWKTHNLKAIAFTKNGRAMVIGGLTSNLVVFCLDTWVVKKVVEFPENISGIKHLEFVPQVFDGGSNKMLAMLTTSQEVYFFDIETSVFLKGMTETFGVSVKITVSCNGRYFANILTSGEVNIYTVEKILSTRKDCGDMTERFVSLPKTSSNCLASRSQSNHSKKTQKSMESLTSIQRQLKELLDLKKLLPILKQYGEYPEAYRILIWKTILKLPANQESFVSLSLKKTHPSYANLETKYPLVNKSLCNSLKKLLSNLSHWCPLFGEVDFLPEFVFPFVKLFHSDPLACFEVVATVIVNWCQNWFEFYPFPPINMLSMMENILGYHDPDLLEFYLKNNITSCISVCPLFHTLFSEVLSKTEWLKLWDHVLSNEPSFLFMAIIAYNVVCRNAIKSLHKSEELENFFHSQNPIDMKKFISKTYSYLKETPDEIHSRQFFAPFRPLSTGGVYTPFLAYPKIIVDSSADKLQSIRKEEEDILQEQMKAMSIKKELEKKLKTDSRNEEQEKLYTELEERIRKTIEEEEDRILSEKQKLENLRHELRLKELQVLEETRDKVLKDRLKRKEIEFERLVKDISKRKAREKAQMNVMEEEIRKYYSELLLRKCQLEIELGLKNGNIDGTEDLESQRRKLKKDLIELQNEWTVLQNSKHIDISHKMAVINGLIYDLETKVAKDMTGQQKNSRSAVLEKIKKKVKDLEEEIEEMLKETQKSCRKGKGERKVAKAHPSQRGNWSTVREKKEGARHSRKFTTPPHDSSNLRSKNGNRNKEKIRRSVKYVTEKSPENETTIRKITTIRRRQKLEDSTQEKRSAPGFGKSSPKSKFTVSSDNQRVTSSDAPNSDDICATVKKGLVRSSSGSDSYETKTRCRNAGGDCPCGDKAKTKGDTGGIEKAESILKLTAAKDPTDSENEIIQDALRMRQCMVAEAKRHQKFQ